MHDTSEANFYKRGYQIKYLESCVSSIESITRETPVPVVVYRLLIERPNIENEWPESCPSGMDEVCIHIELKLCASTYYDTIFMDQI